MFTIPSCFAQNAHEESLATGDARDETIDGGIEAGEERTRDVPGGLCGDGDGLGIVSVEDPAHVLFVLFYIKGTRTIYKDATGIQTLPGIGDNLPLQAPTFLYVLETPLADGGGILAEHAFAGAGDIAEDEVERHLRLAEVTGVVVGDDAVGPAPFGDVLQEDLGTGGDGLVAHEDTALGQDGTHGGGLAAGGSAEVERLQWKIDNG